MRPLQHPSRRTLFALILLAFAVLAAGCRKELSTPLVEQMVEGYYRDAVRVDVDATCPKRVVMEANNHFMCSFTYGRDGERSGWVVVLQHDEYGRITFYRSGPVNHERVERQAEAWLRTTYDLDLDVRCPRDVVPLAGFNFECRAGERTIRVRQVHGDLTFMFVLAGADPQGNA